MGMALVKRNRQRRITVAETGRGSRRSWRLTCPAQLRPTTRSSASASCACRRRGTCALPGIFSSQLRVLLRVVLWRAFLSRADSGVCSRARAVPIVTPVVRGAALTVRCGPFADGRVLTAVRVHPAAGTPSCAGAACASICSVRAPCAPSAGRPWRWRAWSRARPSRARIHSCARCADAGAADARCGDAGSLWIRIDSSRHLGETRRGASRDLAMLNAKN